MRSIMNFPTNQDKIAAVERKELSYELLLSIVVFLYKRFFIPKQPLELYDR